MYLGCTDPDRAFFCQLRSHGMHVHDLLWNLRVSRGCGQDTTLTNVTHISDSLILACSEGERDLRVYKNIVSSVEHLEI
ncbi:hypothetical protein RRG08_044845 [Elysia crispata]|uniref:Uncharacterized protein n=1 Tax=Elysia crispata TaxID=231223 RepID=A0AAE1A3P7_9GAST|nr:hypothetical protein RRG08_044845 [Elysia crispata]